MVCCLPLPRDPQSPGAIEVVVGSFDSRAARLAGVFPLQLLIVLDSEMEHITRDRDRSTWSPLECSPMRVNDLAATLRLGHGNRPGELCPQAGLVESAGSRNNSS